MTGIDLVIQWFSRQDKTAKMEALRTLLQEVFVDEKASVISIQEEARDGVQGHTMDMIALDDALIACRQLVTLFQAIPDLADDYLAQYSENSDTENPDPSVVEAVRMLIYDMRCGVELLEHSKSKLLGELSVLDSEDIQAGAAYITKFLRDACGFYLSRVSEIAPQTELTLVIHPETSTTTDCACVFTNSTRLGEVAEIIEGYKLKKENGDEGNKAGEQTTTEETPSGVLG